jgi:hypothetical protein
VALKNLTMKYIAIFIVFVFCSCSGNQETNIPAQPKDARMLNAEKLNELSSYFGDYRSTDGSGKVNTLHLFKDGTFSILSKKGENGAEEMIEGFIKAKDNSISLVSYDEKFRKVIVYNDSTRTFTTQNTGADQSFTETFFPFDAKQEAKMDSIETAPKQNLITDPVELSKIKKIKDSASK